MGGSELIAVDYDKTLTDPDDNQWGPADEQTPDEEVVEAVRDAYHDGKHIIIWTARKWQEAPKIAGWLTIHEIPYHGICCDKGGADTYVDDKTLTPEDFVADQEDDSGPLSIFGPDGKFGPTQVEFEFVTSTSGSNSLPSYIERESTRNY